MKKFLSILAVATMATFASAVNVNDINTIAFVSRVLQNDATTLAYFAQRLVNLRDDNFQISVFESTQTVSITQQQRSGLLARYQDLKAQLQADVNALP